MKKLVCFLMVGLAFTVLQVSTVGAQMGDPNMPPPTGAPGMQGEGDGFRDCKQIRPKGDLKQLREKKNCFRDVARELGAKKSARAEWKACRQIKPKGNLKQLREKKNCFRDLARSLRSGDPNMPPTMGDPNMPPTMAPPMGDHGGMSNLGAHCDAIQAKNEKKRMKKEVKCLRRALHEHKPTVKIKQTKDGLGGYGCGVKHTGSRPAQIACLRSILNGPGGTPGMPPTMGDPNMPPTMGDPNMPPTMGDPNMPPTMGDPNMPPTMGDPNMPPTMAPPMGDHGGMSNLGAHCDAIQAKNEKKRMKKEVKCLRRALHEHKPTVKIKQTKDGLGGYGCGVKHTGSRPAQIACLRSILNGPGGTPGMPPTMGDPNMPPMTPPPGAPAMTGDRPDGKLGNYGCGNKDRLKHVNCLRELLDTTPQSDKVRHRKEGNKTRGLYGCSGLKDGNWEKHTKCLRRLLDKHGPELAVERGMAPGTN